MHGWRLHGIGAYSSCGPCCNEHNHNQHLLLSRCVLVLLLSGLPRQLCCLARKHMIEPQQHSQTALGCILCGCLVADCEEFTQLLCHTWLRQLISPTTTTMIQIQLPQPVAGHSYLLCQHTPHLLPFAPLLQPALLCPCHDAPIRALHFGSSLCSSSSGPAAAAALAGAAGGVAQCPVTGHHIQNPSSSCTTDSSLLQLGPHTVLRMSPATQHGYAGHWSRHMQSAEVCLLKVVRAVGVQHINSLALFGSPIVCTAAESRLHVDATSHSAAPHAAATASCVASGSGNMLRLLCQVLVQQQQVLIASSHHDIQARMHLPLQQYYCMQPATDGSSLLIWRLACKEQMLPPSAGSKQTAGACDNTHDKADAEMRLQQELKILDEISASLATVQMPPDASAASGMTSVLMSCGVYDIITRIVRDSTSTFAMPAATAAGVTIGATVIDADAADVQRESRDQDGAGKPSTEAALDQHTKGAKPPGPVDTDHGMVARASGRASGGAVALTSRARGGLSKGGLQLSSRGSVVAETSKPGIGRGRGRGSNGKLR